MAGAPAHLQPNISPDDLLSPRKLCNIATTLSLPRRKQLKRLLTINREANTAEIRDDEDVITYLLRRAHRNAAKDALEYDGKQKEGRKKKNQKTKKTAKATRRIEDEVSAQLALDKDAGDVSDENVSGPDTGNKNNSTRNEEFASDAVAIDGEGGVLELALAHAFDGATTENGDTAENQQLQHSAEVLAADSMAPHEKRSDRVRLKRELGDWVETKYDHETGEICCNCEYFNKHDGCPHVLYVEIIHLGRYPQSTNANEQWQCRVYRILHNLKVQCGYLWAGTDSD